MNTHFDKLLGDLETLTKALPAAGDDADPKIKAAAEGGEGDGDGDDKSGEGGEGDGKGEGDDKKKGKPFGKAMTVTLEDGTEVEAEDGTALVKSLTDSLGALTTRIDESDTVLGKALGEVVTFMKSQGTAIASMQTQIKAMAGEGRGRKAVVNLVDKPNAGGAKKEESGINPDAFMAKATSMFESGKLQGQDLAYIESSFNRGDFNLPAKLLSKVGSAA
jgi:hypothetical protein